MKMKQLKKLQTGQAGFTLLELLVVITLIATLATGALIAYENLGENAESAAAANSSMTIDRAIRTFRSVEGIYPNQWDSLIVNASGTAAAIPSMAPKTQTLIAGMALDTTSTEGKAIIDSLVSAGIEEVQTILTPDGLPAGIAPNRAHNESTYVQAREVELWDEDDGYNAPAFISVIPNGNCPTTGAVIVPTATLSGINLATSGLNPNYIQNQYADALEGDECHLVVALGFGGDAAASTAFSNVGISQSPTFANNTRDTNGNPIVDPSQHYARYIGLFHVGEYNGTSWEWNKKARLVAMIAPDGSNIDQLVANSQVKTAQ